MEKIPVMDQDHVGYCWSYAGSQMIDAWRFSHGDRDTNHITSPLPMAIHNQNGLNNSAGGFIKDSRWFTIYNGSCNHQFILQILNDKNPREFISEIYSHFKNNRQFFRNLSWFQKIFADPQKSELQNGIMCYFRDIIPANEHGDLFDYVKNILEKADYGDGANLANIILEACKNNLKHFENIPAFFSENTLENPIGGNWTTEQRAIKFATVINTLLNKKPMQPVGIEYCANLYKESAAKHFPGVARGHKNLNQCHAHASIVIGRKKDKDGKCKFLVRNSWGKDWCPNVDGIECDEKQGGQVWIEEKHLGRFMLGISSLHSVP